MERIELSSRIATAVALPSPVIPRVEAVSAATAAVALSSPLNLQVALSSRIELEQI